MGPALPTRIVQCRPVALLRPSAPIAPAPRFEAPQSWLQCIGRHTAAHHAPSDAARLAVLDASCAGRYRAFLARIYGFEAAVECHVSGVQGLEVALFGARARAARLYQDLVALGLDHRMITALPKANVTVRNTSEALGWLFVIERHVLLAGLIRRALQVECSAIARATGYFATHADGGVRLREFGDVLRSAITHKHARPDLLVAAARRAFDLQQQWYARTQKAMSPEGRLRASVAVGS